MRTQAPIEVAQESARRQTAASSERRDSFCRGGSLHTFCKVSDALKRESRALTSLSLSLSLSLSRRASEPSSSLERSGSSSLETMRCPNTRERTQAVRGSRRGARSLEPLFSRDSKLLECRDCGKVSIQSCRVSSPRVPGTAQAAEGGERLPPEPRPSAVAASGLVEKGVSPKFCKERRLCSRRSFLSS